MVKVTNQIYLYFTWVFPFPATLYLYSTTVQGEILYILFHYFFDNISLAYFPNLDYKI